jgi:putative spermidine/putrescine transport system permease protein
MAVGRRQNLDSISFHAVMGILSAAAVLLIIAPTAIVLIVSFTDGYSLKFPPPGYSLRWYVALADAWQIQDAAWNSLQAAVLSTLVSILFTVPAAFAVARSKSAAARQLESLFMSPLVLPALAFGLSALMYFSLVGIPLSLTTVVIGHVVVCAPYVFRTTLASLSQLDPSLLECSASLGASRIYTYRRVVLPLIGGGIMAGGFIAFMSSFDNVPVSLFLSDARNEMLPIRMWQTMENTLDVRVAAVSGVLILFSLALMLLMERFAGLSRRMR